MSAHDKLKALLGRPIACYTSLVGVTGSVAGAVWLSQLLYWATRGADPSGWIYKSQKEWQQETGLGRSAQDKVRCRLVRMQILREDLRGWPATTHFLLDVEKLSQAIGTYQVAASHSPGARIDTRRAEHRRDKLARTKSTIEFAENRQTSTESRPETTQRAGANLRLSLPDDLSFDEYCEPIQVAMAGAWQLASQNRRRNPALDRLHMRRARSALAKALESRIDPLEIAAAIVDAGWPSGIAPMLNGLIAQRDVQRRSDLLKANRAADLAEVGRENREARDWLQSLSDSRRDEITNEFLCGQSAAFVEAFRAKPNALRHRAEFDRWLVARFAAEQLSLGRQGSQDFFR